MAKGKKSGTLICSFPSEGYFSRVSTRGRGKGNEVRYRYIVRAAKWCWEIGQQYDNSPSCSINCKFPGRLKNFPHDIRMVLGDDAQTYNITVPQILHAVNDSVSKILGIRMELKITDKSTLEEVLKAAQEMDDFYRLDYGKADHEFVGVRLCGAKSIEEIEDD